MKKILYFLLLLSLTLSRYTYAAEAPTPVPVGVMNICSFVSDGNCASCFAGAGVYTPFGCIQTNLQSFIQQILQIAIGLGGGIAFLMIIFGGFTILTSSGNPEKLNSGKEIITSAIAGLLLIVFSVLILKIIGVDIFNIPGLTPNYQGDPIDNTI